MSKSQFDQRKAAAGYVSPGTRPACRNCRHRSAIGATADQFNGTVFDCTLGRFMVSPGGICNHHAPGNANGPHASKKGDPQ